MAQGNSIVWDAAREYAKNGIYVFPLYVSRKADGKKQPRFTHVSWARQSSRSLADIGAWEQEFPDAALAIDCGKSHIVGIDCDGPEGVAAWKALDPPEPLGIVRTRSGGEHWYYREDPDHIVSVDASGKVAPHVDVRGLGGFLFAPPSAMEGGSWEWIEGPDWSAEIVVPTVVVERMKAKPISTPMTPANAGAGDDLFDGPGPEVRRFTDEQATAFIKTAVTKLKAAETGLNGAINDFAMATAHFPWLVDRDRCAKLVQRYLGERMGWPAPDRDDLATINSAYSATEAGRSWTAVKVEAPAPPDETGASAGILPPPSRPLDVARELVARIPQTGGELHWTWWRDDFYQWTGAHWEVMDISIIKNWIYRQTGDATYLVPPKKEGEEFTEAPWAPTRAKVGEVIEALAMTMLLRTEEAEAVMAATNGVVAGRELLEHRPSRFNLWSLPFAYEPDAQCPGWLAFLDQVLPGDREAQEFLAEWFGYVLSGRTDQQKMAALVGKKRSGKGTIARVLAALVGKENMAGLNLSQLGNTFGLEPLLGAALATASDVRWQSRTIGDAIQPILEITGEDHVTVHRKNQKAWKGRLGVRLMLMSNDTPTFSDRSTALVDRMIYVAFRQSFFGREDISLTDKLMGELPGILNWALDGLDRLNGRGRFTQPASGQGEADATRRLADPIGAFIEDWCEVGSGKTVMLDHLFLKYRNWCESEGRVKDTTTKEIFSRELRNRVEGLEVSRVRVSGKQVRSLIGITSEAI